MSAVMNEAIGQTEAGTCADTVAVIGTGPVGIRVAREILQRDPSRPLLIFGDEPWYPYNRVRLSSVLAGDVKWAELDNALQPEAGARVAQHHNCAIVSVDRERRLLVDREGHSHRYGDLILAVGSRAHLPSIPGISQEGVFRFRDMSDMQALSARNVRSRHTVVLGGGLLGLEAARALRRAGTEVTVIEHADRLMPAQLDQVASGLLSQYLQGFGIHFRMGAAVQKVLGDGRVRGVRLRDGGDIVCDTLVVAAGIRPNIDLARACGLQVGRGIVIDDCCRTSDPHIHAIGECAEHRGQVYGLVGPGFEQAAVVAHRLTGDAAVYAGTVSAAQLKVVGRTVFSMGCTSEREDPLWLRERIYRDDAAGVYRKLIVRRGRLVGAIALGDWSELRRVQEAVTTGRLLMPWQLAGFARTGLLWPDGNELGIADWPRDAVVCNCAGVTRGALGAAQKAGCASVDALKQATGASSVCGSCAPLLAELVGSEATAPETTGHRSLNALALLASVALAVWLAGGEWLVPASVQTPLFDVAALWQDGLWKQVTGFSLLVLGVLGLLLSARKRLRRFNWGGYAGWRVAHVLLGACAVLLLLAHTGLQYGERLNAWLLTDYLLLSLVGVAAAIATTLAARRSARVARRVQRWSSLTHIAVAWPLPVLVAFHVLSVYWF